MFEFYANSILFSAMGQAILHTLSCLIVFLDRDTVDTIPSLVGSMMTSIPESLHQQVITTLCYHAIPFTLGKFMIDWRPLRLSELTQMIVDMELTHLVLKACN